MSDVVSTSVRYNQVVPLLQELVRHYRAIRGRYGVPNVKQAVWIRVCQHIDGYMDVPKVLRARVPAAAA